MPHVLVVESLHQQTLEAIAQEHNATIHQNLLDSYSETQDYHVYYQPDISVAEIENNLQHYDAVVTRPKEITTKAITNAEHLKLIVRGGAGMNSIDVAEATKRGIIAENTPAQNSISTAEFTFGFMFELAARRNIFIAHIDVMESSEKELLAMQPESYTGHELYKQRLAIIGLGAIGQEVAKRAHAFGMDVVAYSTSFAKGKTDKRVEALGIRQADSVDEAIAEADIITLHVPLTDKTQGMVNADFLAKVKQGAVIINTARPQLFDAKALEQAVIDQKLGGVAVDGDPDLIAPLVAIGKRHGHVPMLFTHHIADSTEEAQINITTQCFKQVFAYFEQGEVVNQVK